MAFRDAVLADSPLFYLECNETSGSTLADSSGNGHAGSLVGAWTLNQAAMTSGTGKSIAFAGAGRIDVSSLNGATITGDYTIELIQRWGDGTNVPLFMWYNGGTNVPGPAIYWNSSQIGAPANSLIFRDAYQDGYVTWYSSAIADNAFRHCIYVRRGVTLEIWINGDLVSSADIPVAASIVTGTPPFIMGNTSSQYASGAVDEGAFYTHALSSDRIKYHAAAAKNIARVAGVAKLDTGVPVSAVVARDWITRQLAGQTVPASDGTFDIFLPGGQYDVTFFGPSGYQPITHGPIDAVAVN